MLVTIELAFKKNTHASLHFILPDLPTQKNRKCWSTLLVINSAEEEGGVLRPITPVPANCELKFTAVCSYFHFLTVRRPSVGQTLFLGKRN